MIFFLALPLAGCGFARGASDEAGITPKIPASDPIRETTGYAAGALIAYIVGSLGKGWLRSRAEKTPEA